MKRKRARYEVQPYDGGWCIVRRARSRMHVLEFFYNFPQQDETAKHRAVRRAAALARTEQPSQLLIKGRNGRVQQERTYGADPFPPRG